MGFIEMFGGMGKSFRLCRYVFLFIWKLQVIKVHQKYLLHTSMDSIYYVKTYISLFYELLPQNFEVIHCMS